MNPGDRAGVPLAVALDLGSTRIKAGLLGDGGRLSGVIGEPAPTLVGQGLIREGDVDAYAQVVDRVHESVCAALPPGIPLGLASQRSTFVLWGRHDGRPRTPMISWQDRRAASWCSRHQDRSSEVAARSGLLLSPHYVGPKLATIQQADADLRRGLNDGSLLFGTLESYLIRQWSHGQRHETELTMAARTSMLELDLGDWSPELLELFGVPRGALPVVRPTQREPLELGCGLLLSATIADQAAGALAVLAADADSVLLTLGTGGFVLLPCAGRPAHRQGYLTAPILGTTGAVDRYVMEGTINGAGAALDRFGGAPAALPDRDPAPDAFCVPDVAGLGSPYWKAEIGLTFSDAASGLGLDEQRRVVLEGLLFRLAQILHDLRPERLPARIILSGGVTREPLVARALAGLLCRPVEVLIEREAGLLGAARLAAGLDPFADPQTTIVVPSRVGDYLTRKYESWLRWLRSIVAA